MDAVKSAGQNVEVGEVFVETTERKPLPGVGFFGRGGIGALTEPKDGPGEKVPKNCISEIRSWRPVISSMETGS